MAVWMLNAAEVFNFEYQRLILQVAFVELFFLFRSQTVEILPT